MENELFKRFDTMSYCDLMASEKPKLCDYVVQLRDIAETSLMRNRDGQPTGALRSMQLPMEGGIVSIAQTMNGDKESAAAVKDAISDIAQQPSITHKYKKRGRKPKQR